MMGFGLTLQTIHATHSRLPYGLFISKTYNGWSRLITFILKPEVIQEVKPNVTSRKILPYFFKGKLQTQTAVVSFSTA